jgi:hypothetical protein
LANSAITINGSAISLGGSVTLAGDIESVTATSPLTGGGSTGALTVGIQEASTSQRGSVQLSDSTSTTSSVLAATPTAVKSAYDLANGAIPKTLTTTTGDIIYASSANTPARLGIGSTGQVLGISGGVPAWSAPAESGWTNLVATTNFGAVASVTMSSINQTYKDLRIIITGWSSVSGGGVQIAFNNAVDTGYGGLYVDYVGTFVVARTNNGRAYFRMGDSLFNTVQGDYIVDLPNYSSTTNKKFGQAVFSGQDGGSGADASGWCTFFRGNNNAVSSIILSTSGGNFDAGSYELWGRK